MSAALTAVAVAAAGGAGAVARHLCDSAATRAWGAGQVRGILLVNVLGCLLVGLLAGAVDDHAWAEVATVGFLGGFTTFSTSVLQSAEMLVHPVAEAGNPAGSRQAAPSRALAHLLGTAVLGLAAAAAGLVLSPF